jgi:phytoene synthase
VALALGDAVARHGLDRGRLIRLIEGRAHDLEDAPPETLAALEDYAGATSGPLTQLALQVLGADGEDGEDGSEAMQAGHHAGIGWALCGLLRAVPFHARQRRCFLPADLMAAAGVTPGELFEGTAGAGLAPVVREVAACAEFHLGQARRLRAAIPRKAVSAMLTLTLADGDLRRLGKAGYDVFAGPARDNRLMRQARIGIAALRGRY